MSVTQVDRHAPPQPPDQRATSRFEPDAEPGRHEPPRGRVSPDRSLGWVRRTVPVLVARRAMFATALIASFLGMLGQVAMPWIVRSGVNAALVPPAAAALTPFIWMLLGVGVARALCGYVGRTLLFRTTYAVEYDLRTAIYEHLATLSFDFFDRTQTGQLVSRASADVRAVQMALTFAPFIAVQLLMFVVAFGLMLSVHLWLALVAVAPLPVMFITARRMRRHLYPVSWLVQARLGDVASVTEENIAGTRVVRSFAAEEPQIAALTRAATRLQWAALQQVAVRARYAPLLQNFAAIGSALVLLVGGALALHGSVRAGDLLAFMTYVVLLQGPMHMLGFILMMGQQAAASADRIFEILDTAPTVTERPGARVLDEPHGRVELRDVSFAYGNGAPVLQGFSLTVEPGETVALVGRTGCGKSTVARLLPRFYDVGAGAVLIDGHDVRDLTLPSLRAAVGVVTDEPFLFSGSIMDNIAYGHPDAGPEAIAAAAKAAQAHEFIVELPDGYDTVVGERGFTLSGGQRQRIAIARTLLVKPNVLILDDATSAIDVAVEERIHDSLRSLLRQRTTIVIAHRLSTISLADRVCLVEDGRMAASGTHAQLLATSASYRAVLATIEHDYEQRRAAEQERAAADHRTDADPSLVVRPVEGLADLYPGNAPA